MGVLRPSKRNAFLTSPGIEPGSTAWQAAILPLNQLVIAGEILRQLSIIELQPFHNVPFTTLCTGLCFRNPLGFCNLSNRAGSRHQFATPILDMSVSICHSNNSCFGQHIPKFCICFSPVLSPFSLNKLTETHQDGVSLGLDTRPCMALLLFSLCICIARPARATRPLLPAALPSCSTSDSSRCACVCL